MVLHRWIQCSVLVLDDTTEMEGSNNGGGDDIKNNGNMEKELNNNNETKIQDDTKLLPNITFQSLADINTDSFVLGDTKKSQEQVLNALFVDDKEFGFKLALLSSVI